MYNPFKVMVRYILKKREKTAQQYCEKLLVEISLENSEEVKSWTNETNEKAIGSQRTLFDYGILSEHLTEMKNLRDSYRRGSLEFASLDKQVCKILNEMNETGIRIIAQMDAEDGTNDEIINHALNGSD
jgi:hypothetical protein